MTRQELITAFIVKARAWDAAEEEAAIDPKSPKITKITKYVRLSIFDLHTIMLLASRGAGASIKSTEMQLERRELSRSATSGIQELRSLVFRGYIDEIGDRKFALTEKGIRFVNAVIL